MRLRRIQACLTTSLADNTGPPPPFAFAPAGFQLTCSHPEEDPLVHSCFDRGDGEVVGYENAAEPVQLDPDNIGEQWWPGWR